MNNRIPSPTAGYTPGQRVDVTIDDGRHAGTVIHTGHELIDGKVAPMVAVELDERLEDGRIVVDVTPEQVRLEQDVTPDLEAEFEAGLRVGREQGRREATATHEAWCSNHAAGVLNGPGFCQHTIRPVPDGFVIHVYRTDEGRMVMSPYSDRTGDEFNAREASKIASGFMEAARIIDGAALPEGIGTTLAVEQVALLAGVDGFDVREAIARGELAAHRAVDGTSRLLIEWGEGTTWANAQRTFDERSDQA